MWTGKLATDFVRFPSLANVPEVRSNLALITESHKFFMNGSGWQVSCGAKKIMYLFVVTNFNVGPSLRLNII